LYDVNFGGIERMTKRLTIALVALAIFVLVATLPVSADKTFTSDPDVYYYQVANQINAGATVFVGEQHLNLTFATPGTSIGWWAPGTATTEPATTTLIISNPLDFEVPASVAAAGPTSLWYVLGPGGSFTPTLALRAVDPSLDVTIWDNTIGADVSGKSVTKGERIQFGINTNMKDVFAPGFRNPINGNSTGDGYIDLKVKTESGAVYTALYTMDNATAPVNLGSINVTTANYKWGTASLDSAAVVPFNWSTDAKSNGQTVYPTGVYTVWAESLLNNMKETYKDASGAYYTGKTVSATKTLTIVSDTVKITVNKDSVTRSNPFSVTITGRPAANYCLWVKSSSTLDSAIDDQPPMLMPFGAGVSNGATGTNGGNFTASTLGWKCAYYVPQNSGGSIYNDTWNAGTSNADNQRRYAMVSMTSAGTRTVQFDTTNLTKAQKYTIKVEWDFGNDVKSDQVDVKVEKGAVTVVAAGDQSYYLGEEVKFSGTNTESDVTYLFIIGPNLKDIGGQMDAPRVAVIPYNTSTFGTADVQGDNTWSFKWGTSGLALDAGTYTIYAASQPVGKDADMLNSVAYGTVSIIIKKPFVSATASQSTVAQGDKLMITGTAEGQPSAGVQIWILGKNFDDKATTSVNADSTFSYEVKSGTTSSLYPGQYFVVVQHPMQNGVFDIDSNVPLKSQPDVFVINKMLGATATAQSSTTTIFKLEGTGSLQGSDAAEALVQGINDPNVDDTYTKLQFLVENGVINIVPIGDKHVGDKFTIKALTNLAVDDEILVQVYSSSFKPTQKTQSGEFSGATGTVKVTKGDSGMNSISFDVDASTFKPDEYIVTEEAIIQGVSGSALFNVLEGAAPTAVPTPVPTTAAPTTVATPVPTTVPPTPTPTKSPGYGALIALIGLGAVAFIVVRRH